MWRCWRGLLLVGEMTVPTAFSITAFCDNLTGSGGDWKVNVVGQQMLDEREAWAMVLDPRRPGGLEIPAAPGAGPPLYRRGYRPLQPVVSGGLAGDGMGPGGRQPGGSGQSQRVDGQILCLAGPGLYGPADRAGQRHLLHEPSAGGGTVHPQHPPGGKGHGAHPERHPGPGRRQAPDPEGSGGAGRDQRQPEPRRHPTSPRRTTPAPSGSGGSPTTSGPRCR